MVPYGDPETAAFMVRQGQALKADPMYRAAKSFEKSIGTSSYRPIEPQQERDLANIQRQTEYDIGVYRKGVARADLLKAIKPDPMLMAKMPKTFKTDRGQQLYEASAKAAALKKLIDAKTLVPSLELDQSMFEQSGMSLEDLNVRLDTITAPSLRPYEGSVPGLMALDPTDMRGRTKTLQNLMTDVVGGAVDPGDSPSMIIPEDQLSRFMSPEQVEAEKIRRQDARIERLRGMPFEDIVAEVQGTSSNSGR
jgi:hypothetical protein